MICLTISYTMTVGQGIVPCIENLGGLYETYFILSLSGIGNPHAI